ncbi:putative conserved lipoprotein LppL [Mycobacterium xenopi 4042]|uniref:Putative conserved lipoprotein LppL n=1 Tax=Mycobacterium xenopi 4042 TaxID=1299334 RepID=X8BD64_MYCXE|nr:putative conserved lipoprotein LppL [Mycobacterium xenopi 4042]
MVDLAAGHATRIDVAGARGSDFTAIARRADGKLMLGSADGPSTCLTSRRAPPPPSPNGTRSSHAWIRLQHKEIRPSSWTAAKPR